MVEVVSRLERGEEVGEYSPVVVANSPEVANYPEGNVNSPEGIVGLIQERSRGVRQ